MTYKIIYHVGNEIDLKTHVESGTLSLQNHSLSIAGPVPLQISFADLREIKMFRLNRLGRMLKLVSGNETVFLTVTRFNLFNYFAVVNYLKAGELYNKLEAQARRFAA